MFKASYSQMSINTPKATQMSINTPEAAPFQFVVIKKEKIIARRLSEVITVELLNLSTF